MIVDTSALIAILRDEPDAESFALTLAADPAQLNFGDCFAYALARVTDQPLLFKGDDFTHTDVIPAARATRP